MTEVKTIRHRVLELVAKDACVSLRDVDEDKSVFDQGSGPFDGGDPISLCLEVEVAFDLTIPVDDLDTLMSARVREWVQYVEARTSAMQG